MKKVLAVIAVVCVLCAAGSAFAQQAGRQNIPQRQDAPRIQPRDSGYCPCYDGRGRNNRGRADFTPDMPKEIRAKAVELAKLHIDLEEALTSRPVNKAKALEVHANIQKLEQEIEAWRFEQRLNRMESRKIQQELNKRVTRPTPKIPAPTPKIDDTEESE